MANPALLFVETPHELFEALGWVAQAQLITAVGPKRAKLLRDICIRTILDLEQAAAEPALLPLLADILFCDISGAANPPATAALATPTLTVPRDPEARTKAVQRLWRSIASTLARAAQSRQSPTAFFSSWGSAMECI